MGLGVLESGREDVVETSQYIDIEARFGSLDARTRRRCSPETASRSRLAPLPML